jgi:hypothetical protein
VGVSSTPLFPLNLVLFPEGPLPLRIFETRYLDMVGRCMRESREFGVALIRAGREAGPAETVDVGTMARIVDFNPLADGLLGITCVGRQRFRIQSRGLQPDGLNVAEVEPLADEPAAAVPARHVRLSLLLKGVLPQLGEIYANMPMRLEDASWVGHRLAEILPIPLTDKQSYLEMNDPIQRLDLLAPLTAG